MGLQNATVPQINLAEFGIGLELVLIVQVGLHPIEKTVLQVETERTC